MEILMPINDPGVVLSLVSGQLQVSNVPTHYCTRLSLNSLTTAGHSYKVRFKIDLNGSGLVSAYTAISSTIFGIVNCSGNGTYEFTYTPTATTFTNLYLRFESMGGAVSPRTFYIDDVSIEDITVTGYLADIRQSTDYSPFGVILKNRDLPLTSGTGGVPYRYGFNGMEKDDELKGNGNSYDFGARMLDPRIGRWLTIDPLAAKYADISPYVFVNNSPMIFIDPDGEKIRFAKSLDRATRKEYKCELRHLRDNSPTFKAIYRDLKKSKDILVLNKTDVWDNDHYSPERKEVNINFNGNDYQDGANKTIPIHLVIAHEMGHAWRDMKDLDIKASDSPYCYDSPETDGTIPHQVFMVKKQFSTEFEGLHIENIVRKELGEAFREYYDLKSDYTIKDVVQNKGSDYIRLDSRKSSPALIGKDSNYDYNENINHYEKLKGRKWDVKEIDVNKYDNDKYTKSNH